MAPVNKPKHKGKALVAGATAGIFGEYYTLYLYLYACAQEDRHSSVVSINLLNWLL